MFRLLVFLCSAFCVVISSAQTSYDSTYNFVDKNHARLLIGQRLIVSNSPRYKSGFTNVFWANKKGKVYKGVKRHTALSDVSGKKLQVISVNIDNDTPVLEVLDEDNNTLFINYGFMVDNYYPFIVEGFLHKRFKDLIGYSFYLDEMNVPSISSYRNQSNKIVSDIHHIYTRWSCVGYNYDDMGLINRESVEMYNKTYGSINLSYKDFKSFFKKSMDSLKIEYHDSLYNRYKVIEREFGNQAKLDSIKMNNVVQTLQSKYNGQYYAIHGFDAIDMNDHVIIDGISDVLGASVNLIVRRGAYSTLFNCGFVYTKDGGIRLSERFTEYFSKTKRVAAVNNKKLPIKQVKLGMATQQVISLIGEPDRYFNSVSSWGNSNQMYYDSLGFGVICVNGSVVNVFYYNAF